MDLNVVGSNPITHPSPNWPSWTSLSIIFGTSFRPGWTAPRHSSRAGLGQRQSFCCDQKRKIIQGNGVVGQWQGRQRHRARRVRHLGPASLRVVVPKAPLIMQFRANAEGMNPKELFTEGEARLVPCHQTKFRADRNLPLADG